MLYNNGSATVYIGDSNVTTGNGWPIEPQDIFSPSEIAHKSLRGIEGDQMYGIVGSGTQDVRVLIPGRVNK